MARPDKLIVKRARTLSAAAVRAFRALVYAYFAHQGRDLPWRRTRDPYHILVSEIMLQQTQVDRVVEKYGPFLACFPDVKTLAAADIRTVLAAWSGLGYNRRALMIRACARAIVEEFDGAVPNDPPALDTLPGIGPATAASIAAFAFNAPVVFIETNIRTVFIHEFFRKRDDVADVEIAPLVEQTLDKQHPARWYSALMDYGTYLKKQYPNPSRRSRHYSRQSPFEGSDRQLRGMILRELGAGRAGTARALAAALHADAARLREILKRLEGEGFIAGVKGHYALR